MAERKMFRGNLYFCSNFYVMDNCFEWDGEWWNCSENAYQAAKGKTKKLYPIFTKLTPKESKLLGKNILQRSDWDDIKLDIMYDILKYKFSDNEMIEKLLATRGEDIIEWNYWNDTFWGKSIKTGEGENNLGKILMEIRDEL